VFSFRYTYGVKTGIPRDALAPYPWSCGFDWCPAEGYRKRENSAAQWALRLGNDFTFLQCL